VLTKGGFSDFRRPGMPPVPDICETTDLPMTRSLLLAAALSFSLSAGAQTDYKPVLTTMFTAFDTTRADLSAKEAAGNKLVLIAKKFPQEWAPQYYAAYSRIQLSFTEKDAAKRDAYLDDADQYLADAIRLVGKQNDETHVLGAVIANARMAVKPMERYQRFGKIFDEQLDSAKALNPDNPRIYLERGIGKFYMPKMFGGGKKAAEPYFTKAKELFAKEAKDDILKPYWGEGANNYFLGLIGKGGDE
jgi:hypothetical protein